MIINISNKPNIYGQVGRRIEYTGDMANPAGVGAIVAINEPTKYSPLSADILLEDGRILPAVYCSTIVHVSEAEGCRHRVLALDDEAIGSSELQQGIASPAFVKRVRWGCAMAKVARNLDGVDPDRIFAWGEGLGGGVALAVSALDERGLACTAVANPLPGGLEALSSRVRGSVLMAGTPGVGKGGA